MSRVTMAPVIELDALPYPASMVFGPDALADLEQESDWLAPQFYDPEAQMLLFSHHSWLLRIDDRVILIDPGIGNGKQRVMPAYDMLDTPWLERLASAGVQPDNVDVVVCSHLHPDHCGWNTRRDGDRWVPTFPNATYYFAEAERDHWRREVDGRGLPPELAYNAGVYADSVQPVLDAGLVHTVVEAAEIASGVVVEPGPGHTPGHVLVTVDVDGTHVIFAGDVMHNPVQVAHPHLSTMGCFSGSQAETTRREVLARCADDGFLLAAAHFRAPHMFRIERSGDTFRLGTA